jgi:hypothetical protein
MFPPNKKSLPCRDWPRQAVHRQAGPCRAAIKQLLESNQQLASVAKKIPSLAEPHLATKEQRSESNRTKDHRC